MSKEQKGVEQGRRRFLTRAVQLGLLTASIPAITLALPRRSAAGCSGPVLGGGYVGGGTGPAPQPKKTKVKVASASRGKKVGKASDGDHNGY